MPTLFTQLRNACYTPSASQALELQGLAGLQDGGGEADTQPGLMSCAGAAVHGGFAF